MPRTFGSRTVALALGVSERWIDNLAATGSIPGLEGGRRGRERAISDEGVLALELIRILTVDVGLPLRTAHSVACHVIEFRQPIRTANGVILDFDRRLIEERLRDRLRAAIESAPIIRRGRPPRNR